jgi:hypothetical protein
MCLSKHAVKTYGEVETQLYAFLTSALDGESFPSRSPVKRPLYTLGMRQDRPQSKDNNRGPVITSNGGAPSRSEGVSRIPALLTEANIWP